ncbi:hypothetical protein FF011L_01620 [Roseimaritima multifibrata]|uniref:Uncharacterized protein n=1 Tax=Roseimaritima multifibrata TaxID=1930274 RepID=A0A517M975_9BACT|nr:hypothetical protein [Roseimaritima multifibrata]QDS91432.1 hypothetical protein FF011L_01620 [Roseimaritima multifibrata]
MSKQTRKRRQIPSVKRTNQADTEGAWEGDDWSTSEVASLANMNYELKLVIEGIRTTILNLKNQNDPAVRDLTQLAEAATDFADDHRMTFGRLMEGFGVANASVAPLEQIDRANQETSILANLTERATSTTAINEPDREPG